MSRALDKATVAALQSGDPEAAYRAIADVLTPSSSSSSKLPARLELEFLGREHFPLPEDSPYFLRDGEFVAIPKLTLVLAFVVARKRLQKLLSASGETAENETETDNEKLRATAVILMMDPEHLTAANTRKRIIKRKSEQIKEDSEAAAALVASELWLIDSFLTGHLHRHTKSPTLWNHRRWLLSLHTSQISPHSDISLVVMLAAKRHPRNYYAWDHARWLVRSAVLSTEKQDEIALAVRGWCYWHPTDTSGWSFLLFLFTSAHQESRPSPALLAETVAQVQGMAVSLRWTGESVWVFLRTAVACMELAGSTDAAASFAEFKKTAESLQSHVEPASHAHQVLQQAQDWCAAKINAKPVSI